MTKLIKIVISLDQITPTTTTTITPGEAIGVEVAAGVGVVTEEVRINLAVQINLVSTQTSLVLLTSLDNTRTNQTTKTSLGRALTSLHRTQPHHGSLWLNWQWVEPHTNTSVVMASINRYVTLAPHKMQVRHIRYTGTGLTHRVAETLPMLLKWNNRVKL
jgi:hypothetical protein